MQIPYTAKVILCGDYTVGKSSLFRRFSTNTFTIQSGPSSTIGLDHFSKEFQFGRGDAVILDLWDTGGMERVATITSNYYKHAAVAILVCDKVNRSSLSSLPHHLLEVIMHAEQNVKIFLCLAKDDLKSTDGPEEEITSEDLVEFCHQVGEEPGVSETFITSSKSNVGIDDMFGRIALNVFNSRQSRLTPEKSSLCLRNRRENTEAQNSNCNC